MFFFLLFIFWPVRFGADPIRRYSGAISKGVQKPDSELHVLFSFFLCFVIFVEMRRLGCCIERFHKTSGNKLGRGKGLVVVDRLPFVSDCHVISDEKQD
jgi:hypothetical protein